ncbi:MAG: DUF6452 family protein [Bacteroidales bacterium]
MGKIIRYLTIFLCGIWLFSGCGDEGCTESTVSYTIATLTKVDPTSKVDTLKTFSVYGIGQQNDSALVLNQSDTKVISLLLNPDTVYTRFRMELAFTNKDTLTDTLTFYYKNQEYFLSIDCGCSVYNYIDSVLHTGNRIKNIEITNPEVTNEKKPNIIFYY